MTSKVVIFAPYGNAYSKNLAKQFGTSNIIRKRFKTGKNVFYIEYLCVKLLLQKQQFHHINRFTNGRLHDQNANTVYH